ncbi:MAG TPA: outer membrane beta-barrel protein [Chitinophagaceae bacterium]|jgi:hypothetical protein|nr:outer membrane beta-barrel protein [Chitinophagaceae bacterium]
MPNIEPDMNELFRRAAENYPLKQSDDNWENILSTISTGANGEKQISKQRDYKKYFALLLLLLFLLTGYFFLNKNKIASHKILNNDISGNKEIVRKKIQYEKIFLSPVIIQNKSPFIKTKNGNRQPQVNIMDIQAEKTVFNERVVADNIGEIVPEQQAGSLRDYIENTNYLMNKLNVTGSSLKTERKQENKEFSFKSGLYYAVAIGSELSSVKASGYKKGYNLGVFAGYGFNDRFSLEMGLLFAKKYYMSQGKYFSMKEVGATMPAGMDLMHLEGGSYIFQVPVHLHYNFLNQNNHRFFSSFGFSSYLLMSEHNKYDAMVNGVEEKMYGSYKKDRRYAAATIDLGFGYEKNLGRTNTIRLEPYIQFPLKGIGVGDLPVKSAGLRIAFSKTAH